MRRLIPSTHLLRIQGFARRATRTQGFWKDVALLGGSTAAAQLITLSAAPLLTRLYSPDDFGALQLYASVTATLIVVGAWRFELAIAVPKQDRAAWRLLTLAFLALAATCALLAVTFAIDCDWLLRTIGLAPLSPYKWLVPLGLIGGGTYSILNYWAIRRRRFAPIARTAFTRSASESATQLSLGVLGMGPFGLIVGDMIGKTAGVLALYLQVSRHDQSRLGNQEAKRLLLTASQYRRFPIWSTSSSLINSLGLTLPPVLLLALYTPEVAGWYALSLRVVNVPLGMIGRAVSQVYLGNLSSMRPRDNHMLRVFYVQTARRLFLIGAGPIIAVSVISPFVFPVLFGPSWAQAGLYCLLLLPASLAKFVANPLSQTLIVLQRQRTQFAWDLARLLAVIASIGSCSRLGYSATTAVLAHSAQSTLCYLALYWLSVRSLRT